MTDSFDQLVTDQAGINPFVNPDALWNSLKTKVFNFVKDNGGSAILPSTTQNAIYRPDWAKVRQVLKGQRPMTDLGCN